MIILYSLEATLDALGELPAVPFTDASDRQAVVNAIDHINTYTDSFGGGVSHIRLSTLSVGPIGSHGNPGVIEAQPVSVLYEWQAGQNEPETSILGHVVLPKTPSANVVLVCPKCNRPCSLISSDGSPICERDQCDD